MEEDKNSKREKLARDILLLARDAIVVQFRFLDAAVNKMTTVSQPGIHGVMTDGKALYYDAAFLLEAYKKESASAARMYLHILLHCIFSHWYGYGKLEEGLWDLAADIAVEETILSMNLPGLSLERDREAAQQLQRLKQQIPVLTAEKVYRCFKLNGPSKDYETELKRLFFVDRHESWRLKEISEPSKEEWKKISERVKADLKSFSRGKTGEESLQKNLAEATKDRYDYAALLKKFVTMGEDISPSEDEFDYIYYTYGLKQFGNMPLIEPLEYRESRKIKEFVIAIDTSASCRGPIVKGFINKTYSLLKGAENFFTKVNVHIIQCDNEVRSDTKITCDEDFHAFLAEGKLTGFGATDFRPVFTYVNELVEEGEFENLKGLIYFTDGYGLYPEKMPAYDVIFAFLNEDEGRPPVPVWAIRAVIEEEELEN